MKKILMISYGNIAINAIKSIYKKFYICGCVVKEKEVEDFCKSNNINTFKINKNIELLSIIKENNPDLIIVASYNQIISESILNEFKFINIHYALLPKYRGRAVVNWAIINGESDVGVTIHEVVKDLDAGDIYFQEKVKIDINDDIESLYNKLDNVMIENLPKVVENIFNDNAKKIKQDNTKATYCCTRNPEDSLIDWNNTSIYLYNFIRAISSPYPGAFTFYKGKKLFIWKSSLIKNPKIYVGAIPGMPVEIIKDEGVVVLTKDSSILLEEVQFEGEEKIKADKIINSVKTKLGI